MATRLRTATLNVGRNLGIHNILRFFKELQRRNVFRVAIGYIVSCWLLAQGADLILDVIGAPHWVLQSIVTLCALGFPIVLFFSWAYEVTPEGIKREADVERSESVTGITGRKLDHSIMVVLALALAYFVWEARFSESQPGEQAPVVTAQQDAKAPGQAASQAARKSIAVLPFASHSSQAEDHFFGDGIHDVLLTNLAQVGALKVISRTSVLRYRDGGLSIPQIAAELGVGNILEGSVQRSANHVRINVQLIDASTDEHLWAENYDRELSADNLFAIQSDIAREIVSELKLTLTAGEDDRIGTRPTDNLQAFSEFVLGREENARRTVESLNLARRHFEKAIELDPNYALAYVGLADTLNLLATYGNVNPQEFLQPRQTAVDRALELDPNSGEAYTALAALRADQLREDEAELYFRKAIELSPSYSTAYHWYANLLDRSGRSEEALPLARKALELDPMAAILTIQHARILWNLGRVEEANAALIDGVKRNPHFPSHYMNMAANLRELGQLGESMQWLHAGLQLDSSPAFLKIAYCKRFIDFGEDQAADDCLAQVEQVYPERSVGSRVELLQFRGQFQEALEQAVALEQRFPLAFARISLGWNHLNNHQYHKALSIVQEYWPRVLDDDAAAINGSEELNAVVIAGVALYSLERVAQANALLDRALAHMKTIHRVRGEGYSELDVIIHVQRGDRESAIAALGEAIDSGWRDNWWRLRYPYYDAMREEPEWNALMAGLEADIERQKKWFREHKDDPLY